MTPALKITRLTAAISVNMNCSPALAEYIAAGDFKNMVDGSNMDDLSDHRPGKKALQEKDIRSPLQEAGLTKSEIRELSLQLGITYLE